MNLQNRTSARLAPGAVSQDQLDYTAAALLLAHKSSRKFRALVLRLASKMSSDYFSGSLHARTFAGKIDKSCLLLEEIGNDLDLAWEMLNCQRNIQRLNGAAKISVQRKADCLHERILQRHAIIEA